MGRFDPNLGKRRPPGPRSCDTATAGRINLAITPDQGIMVTLTGTDDQGPVNTFTFTDANGIYSFGMLRAGTYTLTFTPPLDGGTALTGTVGGNTDGSPQDASTISGIILASDSVGISYNYGVNPAPS